MREIIYNIIGIVIGTLVMMLFMLMIMTPDKDKFGNFTSFRRYWTDNQYLCENFNGVDKNFCEKQIIGE